MTDPHGIGNDANENTVSSEVNADAPHSREKANPHGAECGCDASFAASIRSDPHSMEESLPAGYSPALPEEAKLPAGVFRCTNEDFARVRLVVAEVIGAEIVAEPAGALRLDVKIGGRTKPLFAQIGETYRPVELTGRKIVVADNLEPRRFGGALSYGAVLTVTGSDGKPRLVSVDDERMMKSGGQVMS